jgi:hypothetical protein
MGHQARVNVVVFSLPLYFKSSNLRTRKFAKGLARQEPVAATPSKAPGESFQSVLTSEKFYWPRICGHIVCSRSGAAFDPARLSDLVVRIVRESHVPRPFYVASKINYMVIFISA